MVFGSLRDGFARVLHSDYGIKAKIYTCSLWPTKLIRFYVVSDDFEHLQYAERQDVVWRTVERFSGADSRRRISSIATLTTKEARDNDDLQKVRKKGK